MSYYDAAKAFWKQWFSLNRSSSSDISWSTFLKRGLMFRVTNMRWHVYRLFFILKSCGNANIFLAKGFSTCTPLSARGPQQQKLSGCLWKNSNYWNVSYTEESLLGDSRLHITQPPSQKGSKAVTTALQKSPFSTMSSRDSIGNIQRIPFNIILQSRLITFSTTV